MSITEEREKQIRAMMHGVPKKKFDRKLRMIADLLGLVDSLRGLLKIEETRKRMSPTAEIVTAAVMTARIKRLEERVETLVTQKYAKVDCPDCWGKGRTAIGGAPNQTCKRCRGDGTLLVPKVAP